MHKSQQLQTVSEGIRSESCESIKSVFLHSPIDAFRSGWFVMKIINVKISTHWKFTGKMLTEAYSSAINSISIQPINNVHWFGSSSNTQILRPTQSSIPQKLSYTVSICLDQSYNLKSILNEINTSSSKMWYKVVQSWVFRSRRKQTTRTYQPTRQMHTNRRYGAFSSQ